MSKSSPPKASGHKTNPRIAEMLRVDHAGEYGAVAIYRGQQAVFGRSSKTQAIAAQLAEMEAEEQKHLDAFDKLLKAAEVAEEEPELAATFAEFREDELHHRDTAVEQGAHDAPGYAVLSRVITAGCHAAIKITEKI